jgi:hypothetical protein
MADINTSHCCYRCPLNINSAPHKKYDDSFVGRCYSAIRSAQTEKHWVMKDHYIAIYELMFTAFLSCPFDHIASRTVKAHILVVPNIFATPCIAAWILPIAAARSANKDALRSALMVQFSVHTPTT